MNDVNENIIIESLLFIKSKGGEVRRYTFDRYLTINFRIDESFNVIPRKLVDEGLIEILPSENETKIILSAKGLLKITPHFIRLSSLFERVVDDLNSLIIVGYEIDKINVSVPKVSFTYGDEIFGLKVVKFGENILFRLSSPVINYYLFDNIYCSETFFTEAVLTQSNYLSGILTANFDMLDIFKK